MRADNRYSQIIERIFRSKYSAGATRVEFERSDIEIAAAEIGIRLPRNLGDVIYSFRYGMDHPPLRAIPLLFCGRVLGNHSAVAHVGHNQSA